MHACGAPAQHGDGVQVGRPTPDSSRCMHPVIVPTAPTMTCLQVIGVGGGGGNAINRIIESEVQVS